MLFLVAIKCPRIDGVSRGPLVIMFSLNEQWPRLDKSFDLILRLMANSIDRCISACQYVLTETLQFGRTPTLRGNIQMQVCAHACSLSISHLHTHTYTQYNTIRAKGIYLSGSELRMWVQWEINSSIRNGRRCLCISDEDWLMSKGSNGKERGGQSVFQYHLYFLLFLLKSFLSLLSHSLLLFICLPFLFFCPALLVLSSVPFPPIFLSLSPYWRNPLLVWRCVLF